MSQPRIALSAVLTTALVQDPLRKLETDQPIYFVAFALVVYLAAFGSSISRGMPVDPNKILGWRKHLATPFAFLATIVVLQSAHSYLEFKNVLMTGIGIAAYVAPLGAIIFGYHFLRRYRWEAVRQFIVFYLIIVSLALVTVYLEFAGLKLDVFGQVGTALVIIRDGVLIVSNSGTFRTGEMAAWYAATGACFILLLVTERQISLMRLGFAALCIMGFVAIGVLTGRRKMIVEISFFVGIYFLLIVLFQRGGAKLASAAAICGVVATLFLTFDSQEQVVEQASNYENYLSVGSSSFSGVWERFLALGLEPIQWSYDMFGFFGAGVGVGSVGASMAGLDPRLTAPAEGGLGKLAIELGVPGLIVVTWFVVALVKHVFWILRTVLRSANEQITRVAFGIFSFLLANVATFIVATQTYNDLFVMLLLGTFIGFLFALPALAIQEVPYKIPSARSRLASTPRDRPSAPFPTAR